METLESTKTKKLELKLTSAAELTNFLKRFSSISGSLLIEIDGEYVKAKTHTPERSVVKSSKIEVSRVFSNPEAITTPVIFGVYSLDKLIKSFSHFEGSEVTFNLFTENTPDGTVGTDIILKNDSLKINFQCATLRLFTHITDEMMDRIGDVAAAEVNFVLTKELQSQVNALSSIDSDQKLLSFNLKNGEVAASGKSFNKHLLSVENKDIEVNVSVYKSQFAYLDKEDLMVYMNEDRLIFHSIESETRMIIGKAD
jgi:hypothetical protein